MPKHTAQQLEMIRRSTLLRGAIRAQRRGEPQHSAYCDNCLQGEDWIDEGTTCRACGRGIMRSIYSSSISEKGE
jgi:hypothetical protein